MADHWQYFNHKESKGIQSTLAYFENIKLKIAHELLHQKTKNWGGVMPFGEIITEFMKFGLLLRNQDKFQYFIKAYKQNKEGFNLFNKEY